MSATVKIRNGRAWATVTGPAAAELEAVVRSALGPAADLLESEMERIRTEHIETDWPVKTGTSRRGWVTRLHLTPARYAVEAVLVNPEVYVRYIRTTKHGKDTLSTRVRSPLQTEVMTPVRAVKARLSPELKRLLVAHLKSEVFHG